MTNADVFRIILAEASNRPVEEIEELYVAFSRDFGILRHDDEMPDDEAEELLASLRNELPGIKAWAAKAGGRGR